MKFLKRTMVLVLVAFIVIQFFRPEKNISAAVPAQHISTKFSVPEDVEKILSNSCYDCHSNNTRYPWYFFIQPVAWWLNDHVREGKQHLNFDEFTSYQPRRQYRKFEQITDEVRDDEMPLSSYLAGHSDAILSPEQKDKIFAWCTACRNEMKCMYPADSLKKQ